MQPRFVFRVAHVFWAADRFTNALISASKSEPPFEAQRAEGSFG